MDENKSLVPLDLKDNLAICKTVEEQINLLAINTPAKFIMEREGRKGQVFSYIETHYAIARLNATFFYDWDLEVTWQHIDTKENQVVVQVRLTVRFADGRKVTKMAYGSSEVKRTKAGEIIDLADDLKAAESDALKKSASLLGIGWDVYAGLAHGSPQKEEPKAVSPDKDDFLESVDQTPTAYPMVVLTKSDGTKIKVTKFEALKYFGLLKKAMGDEAYHAILKLNGYEHCNKIPENVMASIYGLLVEAWKTMKEKANEAD